MSEALSSIPTLTDVMNSVAVRIVASVDEGAKDDELFGAIAVAFAAPTDEVDLIDLLVLARGCQAAAFQLQERGDPQSLAGLYHSMGQDMIAKAIGIVGASVGVVLAQCDLSRH